jgi:hypothetical protein
VAVDCRNLLTRAKGDAVPESLFFVFSNPVEGHEDEFNRWYDTVHVREVLAVPGITKAQRYALRPLEIPPNEIGDVPPPPHRYLALYDVDGDRDDIMKNFLARLGSGEMSLSPALDLGTVSMGFWAPLGPAQTSQ